ncbi:MAG: restriction endonuclease subunit S [Tolypothrix sp. Co-bin9]|nr:restriction endonuclease subunit S [Tolypothrix sp. Co-bin9]
MLQSLAGGGTRSYIGITKQKQLPFVLPSLPEQKAIAQILSW